jgi:prophage maintenance system killer protein
MDTTKYIAAATFAKPEQSRNVYEALENLARSNADAGYDIIVRHFFASGDRRITVAFLTMNKEPVESVKTRRMRVFTEHGGQATELDNETIAVLLLPLEKLAPRGSTETRDNFTRFRSGM